jgi:hypothetical protein
VSALETEARRPLYEIDPLTGATIEVYYADRSLETFGRFCAGWFWQYRRRRFSPDGPATGPFATSYAAYRHAIMFGGSNRMQHQLTNNINADMVRT